MRNYYIALIILISCSCTSSHGPTLIASSDEFVSAREVDDDAYFDDHENFISKYFSVSYEDEKIVATTLININCVHSSVASIEVSNDTIYLKAKELLGDERLCPELHKFTYIISNPENRKYKIVSTK
jgi:hypothetical protein